MEGTMRGICKMAPGKGAEYRTDLPIPRIGDGEVLMKVHASAICGTDLHIYGWNEWAANRMKKLPIVFGHETAGEIVEIGKDVTGFQVGDRISVETHIPCNHCFQCENGRRHICENMKLFGVTEPGAFAEYAPVPKDCIVRLDDAVSYEMGAMLEAMGAGVHGVEKAEVRGKTLGIYFRGDRLKNRQTLADLEISAMQREEEVLALKMEHYSSGPTEDRLNHGEDMWVFGKQIKGREVYIKITSGKHNDKAFCISFHIAEHKMSYPFSDKK